MEGTQMRINTFEELALNQTVRFISPQPEQETLGRITSIDNTSQHVLIEWESGWPLYTTMDALQVLRKMEIVP